MRLPSRASPSATRTKSVLFYSPRTAQEALGLEMRIRAHAAHCAPRIARTCAFAPGLWALLCAACARYLHHIGHIRPRQTSRRGQSNRAWSGSLALNAQIPHGCWPVLPCQSRPAPFAKGRPTCPCSLQLHGTQGGPRFCERLYDDAPHADVSALTDFAQTPNKPVAQHLGGDMRPCAAQAPSQVAKCVLCRSMICVQSFTRVPQSSHMIGC